MQIDINADLGESYGRRISGNDELIFPYLTSCNIACGLHGGDPVTMRKTIQLAIQHQVQIGAHPSYPDLLGFGRKKMDLDLNELYQLIGYQINILQKQCEELGSSVVYVKPHGALYNSMVNDLAEAETVAKAIADLNPDLALMGLAESQVKDVASKFALRFIPEAFADRRYTVEGKLQSRKIEGSVINDPAEAVAQVLSIVKENKIEVGDNHLNIKAESICIHGDNPSALAILKAIDKNLLNAGISKHRF